MARIVGVEIPDNKKIAFSLRYIYGIGPKISQEILDATNIDKDKRTKDLTSDETKRLYEYIDKNVQTEGQVKQTVFANIKRIKDNKSFRGSRHKKSLPARGQNTRSNGRTRKGRSRAVGGLKIKVAK